MSDNDNTVNVTEEQVNTVDAVDANVPVFNVDNTNDNVEEEIDMSKYTKVDPDELDEDPEIPGQKYVLMSFMSPEGIMGCSVRLFKFRGAYPTLEAAQKRVDDLEEVDEYFKIYLCEAGKWCEFDPPDEHVEKTVGATKADQKFIDEQAKHKQKQMNELARKTKEKIDREKRGFSERREESKLVGAAEDRSNKLRSKTQEKKNRKRQKAVEKQQNSGSAKKQRMQERLRKRHAKLHKEKEPESKMSKLEDLKHEEQFRSGRVEEKDLKEKTEIINKVSSELTQKENANNQTRKNIEALRNRIKKK